MRSQNCSDAEHFDGGKKKIGRKIRNRDPVANLDTYICSVGRYRMILKVVTKVIQKIK